MDLNEYKWIAIAIIAAIVLAMAYIVGFNDGYWASEVCNISQIALQNGTIYLEPGAYLIRGV